MTPKSTDELSSTHSNVHYTRTLDKWESIKPIRGRGDDVRPVGDRRRDWEQVVRTQYANGEVSYGAKLYNTQCVEHFKDRLVISHGGWCTNCTTKFICDRLGQMRTNAGQMRCWRGQGSMWVYVRDHDGKVVCVPLLQPGVTLWWCEQVGDFRLPEGFSYYVRRPDPEQTKPVQAKLKPFFSWLRTILTWSDGFVADSATLVGGDHLWGGRRSEWVDNLLDLADEENSEPTMLAIVATVLGRRVVGGVRLDYDSAKAAVYKHIGNMHNGRLVHITPDQTTRANVHGYTP